VEEGARVGVSRGTLLVGVLVVAGVVVVARRNDLERLMSSQGAGAPGQDSAGQQEAYDLASKRLHLNRPRTLGDVISAMDGRDPSSCSHKRELEVCEWDFVLPTGATKIVAWAEARTPEARVAYVTFGDTSDDKILGQAFNPNWQQFNP
jgi:hypothetical protein